MDRDFEPPRELLGAQNLLAWPMDRDFDPLRELLRALLTVSLLPRRLQSSQIWSSELSGGYVPKMLGSQHLILRFSTEFFSISTYISLIFSSDINLYTS